MDISAEVEGWYASLKSRDRAAADRALDLLADRGPELRMPHARPLGGGLLELRFTCEGTARRVTYYIGSQRVIITLTTFRKQRQQERRALVRPVPHHADISAVVPADDWLELGPVPVTGTVKLSLPNQNPAGVSLAGIAPA